MRLYNFTGSRIEAMRVFISSLVMIFLLAGCALQSGSLPPGPPSPLFPTQTSGPPVVPTGTAIPPAGATVGAAGSLTPTPGSARELERLGLQARGRVGLADVPLVDQPNYTSCGEAAFAMAWNFMHPASPLEIGAVEAAGLRLGVYFPASLPGPHGYLGTSPAGMQTLGSYFASLYHAPSPAAGNLSLDEGDAFAQLEAKGLIYRELSAGRPVLVEVTDILGQPSKLVNDSHYILLLGMDFDNGRVTFNDPYLYLSTNGAYAGRNRSTGWDELWASWSRNRDILPGTNVHAGRGWYMLVR